MRYLVFAHKGFRNIVRKWAGDGVVLPVPTIGFQLVGLREMSLPASVSAVI